MKHNILNLFFCVFVVLQGAAQQKWYVNHAATGAQNGQRWADAYLNLHAALDAAKAGDSIWVAGGSYKPDNGTDRNRSFVLKSGVGLFGGFAGHETALNQRNLRQHPVVLSGDIGVPGDSTDNSYTILYMAHPDSNTIVDGFVFDHGNANYTGADQLARSRYKCGGAVYMEATDGWAYAEVRNCVFQYNYATTHGGAVFINGAGVGSVAPRFTHCIFKNNRARLDGGALYRDGSSWTERNPDFAYCDFIENEAGRYGGGLYYSDAERSDRMDLYGCRFLQNKLGPSATTLGAACVFDLGRMNESSHLRVSNCEFKNHLTNREVLTTLALEFLGSRLFEVDSSNFENNEKSEFFINLLSGNQSIRFCKFIESNYVAAGDRGGFFTANAFINKERYISLILGGDVFEFSNNFLKSEKGAEISLIGDGKSLNNVIISKALSGYGLLDLDGAIQLNHNLFSCDRLLQVRSPKTPFANCILINTSNNNNDYIRAIAADKLELDYCSLVNYNCKQDIGVSCGAHNLIGVQPMFRDSAGGDFRLLPCSPLVGAGLNSAAAGILTDLDGRPRIAGGRVDIGPYETPAFAWAAAPLLKPACRDANDGSVEFSSDYGCPPVAVHWTRQDGGSGSGSDQLAPGAYFFELTDARGQRLRDTLDILPNPGPTLAATATPVQCGSDAGGSAAVNTTGGIPPVALRWSNGQTAAQLAQLPPGGYTVTATDAAGCRDSAAVSVARLGALTLLVGGNVISCFGQRDGRAVVTPLGGKQPFRFQWDDGATDSLRTQLPPGRYAVTVADAFGCTTDYLFKLSQPDSLRVGGVAQDASGPAIPDGSAIVGGIQGGTAPFRYLWSTGATTDGLFNLLPGLYTVTVRDFNGCTAVQTLEVRHTNGAGEAPGRVLLVFYPNPAAGATNVQAVLPASASGLQLMLYDSAGRLLQQISLPNTDAQGEFTAPIPLGDLPAGLYRAVLLDARGGVRGQGAVVKR